MNYSQRMNPSDFDDYICLQSWMKLCSPSPSYMSVTKRICKTEQILMNFVVCLQCDTRMNQLTFDDDSDLAPDSGSGSIFIFVDGWMDGHNSKKIGWIFMKNLLCTLIFH